MFLGNIQFSQIKETLGYELTEKDKLIWDEFHNNDANLHGMKDCFHVFDIPRCIIFRGEKAKESILKMFTPEKIVNPCGSFHVYSVD